jgi:hypothetical protein
MRAAVAGLGVLLLVGTAHAQSGYWTKWSWTRKLDTQGQIVYPDSEWKQGDFYDTGQECRRSIVGLFKTDCPTARP